MGAGTYSYTRSLARSKDLGYATKSAKQIFTSSRMEPEMDPKGVNVRESRDSLEHPESVPIIIGLDMTGSMQQIPHYMITEGLTKIVESIVQAGIEHPQILFMGIGDHECDDAPLQVAQFESSDELLDKWLKLTWLESGGGGNAGESYHLAWYFAAHHTSLDHWEKRQRKGYLFTIGDEPVLETLPKRAVDRIMGDASVAQSGYSSIELFQRACETYHVFHIHLEGETWSGAKRDRIPSWQKLIGENLLVVDKKEELVTTIATKVANIENQTAGEVFSNFNISGNESDELFEADLDLDIESESDTEDPFAALDEEISFDDMNFSKREPVSSFVGDTPDQSSFDSSSSDSDD